MAANIVPTTKSMLGGADSYAGQGAVWTATVTGTWSTGDYYTLVFTNIITGVSMTLGRGTLTGLVPSYALTYRNKLNVLCSQTWAFSAIGQPTIFNSPEATGNGYVTLSDAYSESDNAQAIVPYQGRLAVLGQNNIQIWQVDADPLNYQLLQILENIGTVAKLSAVAFGELDVFFLHRTGLRSLRVRDASNNAYLSDVGSPVDFLVQASLASASATQKAAACAVMEPNRSQYWCFLYDTIYVLSYFPQMKITAWSTFKPTYQSGSVSGFSFTNGHLTNTVVLKIAYVNDVTKAIYTSSAVTPTNSITGVAKGRYAFVLVNDVVVGSQAITNGLLFSGNLTYSNTGLFTFTDNQTAFTPQKFVVYNGQVIARAADGFYVYGGATGESYDNTICAWETSWLDADTPANYKQVKGVDVAQSGTWDYYGSVDFLGDNTEQVLSAQTNPTFVGGRISMTLQGTHVKVRGQTTGVATRAVVSNLLLHYKPTPVK